jgi:hypothetical protein
MIKRIGFMAVVLIFTFIIKDLYAEDILLVTTSLLQKDAEFNSVINEYKQAVRTIEGLTAAYVELDTPDCLNRFGVFVQDAENWREIRDVISRMINMTNAHYIIILGGTQVVPRPEIDIYLESDDRYETVPSDSWYIDFDENEIADEGYVISRMPDVGFDSSKVINALLSAIDVHCRGGFSMNQRVEFGEDNCPQYETICQLMSSSDSLSFTGHGMPQAFYTEQTMREIFSCDNAQDVNFLLWHPIIFAFGPCNAGQLFLDRITLATEFMDKGAAAYIGNTSAEGYIQYFIDRFYENLESEMIIGDAFYTAIQQLHNWEAMVPVLSSRKVSAHQYNLYGDPTIRCVSIQNINRSLNLGFEFGNLLRWHKSQNAGSNISVSPFIDPVIKAQEGICFASISNKNKKANEEIILSSPWIPVTKNINAFSFRWNFLTNERPSNRNIFNDTLMVVLEDEDGAKFLIARMSVNDLNFLNHNMAGFLNVTGWNTFVTKVNIYSSKKIKLHFAVKNVGNANAESAVLVDDIRVR